MYCIVGNDFASESVVIVLFELNMNMSVPPAKSLKMWTGMCLLF